MTDFKRKDEVFTLGNIMMKQALYQHLMAQRVLLLLIILKRFDELLSNANANANANGNLTSTTDITGATTTFTYDTKGRITSIDGPRTDVQDVTTYTYDQTTGNLTAITQPIIGTTTYSNHDTLGNPQTITDPNGKEQSGTGSYFC